MKFTSLPYFVQLAVHTLLIAASAKLGMLISPSDLLIWSPAGLSIAILTIWGIRFLPAVVIGASLVYLPAFQSYQLGAAVAAGASLEAFIGYQILRKYRFDPFLKTFRDVGLLVFAAGAVSTLINSFFSVTVLTLMQQRNAEDFIHSVLLWWTGNLAAVIIVAPLLFVLIKRTPRTFTMKGMAELLMVIVTVHLASRFVFHESAVVNGMNYALSFVMFPFAVWAAVRFGMTGSVVTTYVIAMNAVMSAHVSSSHAGVNSTEYDLFVMDLFLIVLGITSLVLAVLTEERISAERSIQKSKESYRIITEQTGQIIYDYNVTTGEIRWSGALAVVTQYMPEEFVHVGAVEWVMKIHPEDRTRIEQKMIECMRTHREFNGEYRFQRKDGSYVFILDRGVFLYRRHTDTEAYHMLGTMSDVSPVRQTMSKLSESEERFRILIENSADGIILLDKRSKVMFVSPSVTSIIGYQPEELMNTSILSLLHESEARKYAFTFGRLVVESGRRENLLGRFRHKNGEWVYIEGMVTNLLDNSNVKALVANFRNVTDRMNADERLRRSLQEKEILLKEVHHRVKNNMQVISSLLNLQSASLKNERTLSMFRESQNRVKSMALVHEILYQSQDIASVNFSLYVKQMSASLQKSFGARARDITVKVKVPNIVLDIDEAIPCGLIVNELISNSIKYAFPKRSDGLIAVELKRKKNSLVLTVRDNGVGLPAKAERSQSLGLTLVRALSEQLKGELTVSVDRGTIFTVEFPIHPSITPIAV